jgi:hypothetical protein
MPDFRVIDGGRPREPRDFEAMARQQMNTLIVETRVSSPVAATTQEVYQKPGASQEGPSRPESGAPMPSMQ